MGSRFISLIVGFIPKVFIKIIEKTIEWSLIGIVIFGILFVLLPLFIYVVLGIIAISPIAIVLLGLYLLLSKLQF